MTPTLLDIPFDHYQRYAAATHLLKTLELQSAQILEVGANRQRLLGKFLPSASFLYTDLHAEGDEQDFVVADATALPFPDQSFDAVVSLDVVEHIPAHLRARAIAEMARVAGRAVIVGFPPDRPWVHQAEVVANERWRELFGEDYVWLQEHKEFGLVDTDEIVQTFETAGMQVLKFGQGDADLWANLMGAHFIKVKFPELESLVTAADRLYNSRVFAGDHSEQPYREYYVAVRQSDSVDRLHANPPFRAKRDEEATTLLSGLASGLREIALRTENSEREWDSTARMLNAYIADLSVAKSEWSATADVAHELLAAKDAAEEAHADSRRKWDEQVAELHKAKQLLRLEIKRAELELAEHDLKADEQRAEAEEQRKALEQRIADDAAAYRRSRTKWKIAMTGLALIGALAGFVVAWIIH